MPREPRPYLYRGYYVTDARGTVHHKLCPESEGMVEAKKQLHAYLARIDEGQRNGDRQYPPGPGIRPSYVGTANPHGRKVGESLDAFLAFKETEHAEGAEHLTYVHYSD